MIVRKDIFDHKGFNFSRCFPVDCQLKYLPSSLRSLVSIILNGLNIKDQEQSESQACLTVCETIIFNTKKRYRYCKTKTGQTRLSVSREPPLPLYVGLSIHSSTRSKTLIEKMYQMGISVSYDRIMEIEDWLAKSLCTRFKEDGCVSPACLRKGIFSVGALDNIDHNTSSTTSFSSFHGTGISIFQFPTESVPGEIRPSLVVPPPGTEHQGLPESYATVPTVALNTSSVSVPACNLTPLQGEVNVDDAKQQEGRWGNHALSKLSNDDVSAEDSITWAAYHSKNQQQTSDPPAITALLPLFYNQLSKVWVAFGMGRHFSVININGICSSLGESKPRALPVFHAFTGCDCTSQFCGIGKKTAWRAWELNNEVTPALEDIATHPFQKLTVSSEKFQRLERFTIIMYDKSSPLESVNDTRLMLFSKRNRDLDNIPPTQVDIREK